MKKLDILYHLGRKEKMYSWSIWTEDNLLCVEYGTVDGQKQVTRKAIVGKNIGKTNESTPAEQAEKEARALWAHKKARKMLSCYPCWRKIILN